MHTERKIKLNYVLDSEKWKQADVPSEFQALVTYIYKNECFPYELCISDINECNKTANIVFVGDEKYAVVGTVLILIQIIHEYCRYTI
jgi:vacuolar protein sorting-associated protein 54